jgi:hypothetical protein
MPRNKEKGFVLTRGSKYRVLSVESRDRPMETVGTFKGFTSIGPDEALVIELEGQQDSEALRIIPLHMILAIDVLEAAEEEEETKEPEKMYG